MRKSSRHRDLPRSDNLFCPMRAMIPLAPKKEALSGRLAI